MEFYEHKPIYLQIADRVCEYILNGEWTEDERIPSVREMGINLGVNPNTVMRTFEYLQNAQIIYNRRGVGYYVTQGASDHIKTIQKEEFLKEELPKLIKKMDMLGLKPSDLFRDKKYN
jgi:DNA-binding transcriptional regulator YhcF (GntR family)